MKKRQSQQRRKPQKLKLYIEDTGFWVQPPNLAEAERLQTWVTKWVKYFKQK